MDRGGEIRTPDLLNPIQDEADPPFGQKLFVGSKLLAGTIFDGFGNLPILSRIIPNRPGFVRTNCVRIDYIPDPTRRTGNHPL